VFEVAAMTNDLQLVISDIAARTIQKWADALEVGEIEIWQLPRPLAGLYHLGYYAGRDSHEPRVVRLESECDRLYERLYYGRDLPDVQLRRMRAAAEDYWEHVVGPLIASQHEQRGNS
jgi:hypothetical protein